MSLKISNFKLIRKANTSEKLSQGPIVGSAWNKTRPENAEFNDSERLQQRQTYMVSTLKLFLNLKKRPWTTAQPSSCSGCRKHAAQRRLPRPAWADCSHCHSAYEESIGTLGRDCQIVNMCVILYNLLSILSCVDYSCIEFHKISSYVQWFCFHLYIVRMTFYSMPYVISSNSFSIGFYWESIFSHIVLVSLQFWYVCLVSICFHWAQLKFVYLW